jgi:hypothetical protein
MLALTLFRFMISPRAIVQASRLISTYMTNGLLARCVDIHIIALWGRLRTLLLKRHSWCAILVSVFMYNGRLGPWHGASMLRCGQSA